MEHVQARSCHLLELHVATDLGGSYLVVHINFFRGHVLHHLAMYVHVYRYVLLELLPETWRMEGTGGRLIGNEQREVPSILFVEQEKIVVDCFDVC